MIFGDCPYDGCSGFHAIPCLAPGWTKEKCETCGREFWLRHSRIDPEAYTLEGFAQKYAVDEIKKQIIELNPAPPPTE